MEPTCACDETFFRPCCCRSRILLLSPHPGEVKAELNSAESPEAALQLESRIQHMLFSEEIEEAENV